MTFSSLEIDADIMRESSAGYFVNEDNNELQELFKTPAKNQLKIDICGVLNLRPENTSDMSTLDTLVDNYQTHFKQMLMYLQLFYYFQSILAVGTKTELLMNNFLKLYNGKLKEAQNFKINDYAKATMKRLVRG